MDQTAMEWQAEGQELHQVLLLLHLLLLQDLHVLLLHPLLLQDLHLLLLLHQLLQDLPPPSSSPQPQHSSSPQPPVVSELCALPPSGCACP